MVSEIKVESPNSTKKIPKIIKEIPCACKMICTNRNESRKSGKS